MIFFKIVKNYLWKDTVSENVNLFLELVLGKVAEGIYGCTYIWSLGHFPATIRKTS